MSVDVGHLAPRGGGPSAATLPPRAHRSDIQGLRALAVLLVVLYHADVPGVRAGYVGVDVFFVISGFLITGQLLREAARTGRTSFARFYARRVRRLLPAALLVVLATLAVARWALPPLRVSEVVTHSVWTTFYGINYRLAAEGVDYQDAGAPPSPLQHYWSLAVEEQFYLLWPLLVVAALAAARRRGPRALPAVLGGVVALSLTASVVLTATSPATSYFALHTRAWELGAGALVALGASRLSALDRRTAAALAWAGLLAVVASALVYSDATAFPGAAALLPVVGTAAVIAAGCGGQARSVTRAVSGRAVQTVGTLSYGWYLWHWPVLLLYPVVLDVRDDTARNLAVSAGALGLAWLTHRFVERPTRAAALPERTWLALGAAMSALTIALAGLTYLSLPPLVGSGPPASVPGIAAAAPPAALAAVQRSIDAAGQVREAPSNLTPDVWEAVDDFPPTKRGGQRCMADYTEVEQGPCVYGDPDGERTLVLIGDSHADQWQPAFDTAGARAGWRVVEWAKAACPLTDRPVPSSALGREYTECATWRAATLDRVVDLRPDLVVATQSDETGSTSYGDEDYARTTLATLERLRAADVPVVYLQDTHYPGEDVPACLSDHLGDVRECGRANGATRTTARRDVLEGVLTGAGVPVVDPTPWQCSSASCPAVVGNVVVYRDDSHLTATYSRWLAPFARSLMVDRGTRDR